MSRRKAGARQSLASNSDRPDSHTCHSFQIIFGHQLRSSCTSEPERARLRAPLECVWKHCGGNRSKVVAAALTTVSVDRSSAGGQAKEKAASLRFAFSLVRRPEGFSLGHVQSKAPRRCLERRPREDAAPLPCTGAAQPGRPSWRSRAHFSQTFCCTRARRRTAGPAT